jgi:hypothetical protein
MTVERDTVHDEAADSETETVLRFLRHQLYLLYDYGAARARLLGYTSVIFTQCH